MGEEGAPPSRGETTLLRADEDRAVQSKANKAVEFSRVGMYMESLISEEWKHSGADQSPNISASRHCSILPGRLSIDPRRNLRQCGHPPPLLAPVLEIHSIGSKKVYLRILCLL